jgi:hypothetical protein
MFVIVCKESRCVQLLCSQDPKTVMALAPDVDTHYDIIEFENETPETYQGKFLKVINGELIDLGYVLELEKEGKIEGCGDCPPYA